MFYKDPSAKKARVVIFYRDVQRMGPYSHKALGVNALQTCKVLRKLGIHADPKGVWPQTQIEDELLKEAYTHAVIEAPWVSMEYLGQLLSKFPNVHFVVRTHSQIGFLQVEPGAIKNVRDMIVMQDGVLNLSVATNSKALEYFLSKTYRGKITYLPNLYDLERTTRKRDKDHSYRKLVIGSFGALRLLKNHLTAAAGAMLIAERRGCDLEFWINVGREENSGKTDVLPSLRNLFQNLPWAKLVEQPWEEWASFRRTVSHLDLLMQVSFTETFNITAADAVAENVPVVCGDAIEWLPPGWKAIPDNAEDVARVGMQLLSDPSSSEDGYKALAKYVTDGKERWLEYLDSNPT
jgi:hypothetical protein